MHLDDAPRGWWHRPVAAVRVWCLPQCEVTEWAIELLETSGMTVERVPVLERPPSAEDVRTACRLSRTSPRDMVRRREPRFAELRVNLDTLDDEAIFALLAQHPILLQRPMVIMGPRAVLARPPERALTLLTPKLPAELPPGFPKGLDVPPR
jgi:arsenate reductase